MNNAEQLAIASSFVINAMIVLFIIITSVFNAGAKSACLNGQNTPNRWGNRICQEYKNGQWVTLDEYKVKQKTWTYNQAALELLEENE